MRIFPAPHPATLPEEGLLRGCDERRGKTHGPGGQHKNKTETQVFLLHRDTSTVGQAGEERSLAENRKRAIFRLRLRLAIDVRTAPSETPSPLWRGRVRPAGRIVVNPEHTDYPALLAEAFDVLAAVAWDPRAGAEWLGVTQSQLIKLVKDHPAALVRWNEERDLAGLHPLR